MTRSILLLTALLLAFAVGASGCGGDDEDDEGTPTTTVEEQAFETREDGVLTVGSDIPFPPFEFREGGRLTGFDVDLMEEIASRLDLRVKWVDSAFDTIFTQLAGGRFDAVASATTITEERKRQVSFTIPYYKANQALTVNSRETPDIKAISDLRSGHVVAVQKGTTGEAWAQARENLPEGVRVRSFVEAPDTYIALEAGSVDAVIFDEPSAIAETRKRPGLRFVQIVTQETYGFAVDPKNDALLDAINEALRNIIQDGTYARIYARYEDLPPGGQVKAS